MAIIKDVTVKINNGTATLDAPVQFYEKDHDVELRFRLMDYKYKYDKDPQNILNSVDEDILEAYTTIVNPKGYELEQINGVVKNDIVIFRLDPTYTDELDELGTYKLQIHIKCTHSEFTIPPITFEVLQRLTGIKVVTDGEDEVDNSEILDNSSKFVSDETGKLIIEWKKGDMISSAKLNAMVDVINDAVDEEAQRQLNEVKREQQELEREQQELERQNELQEALDSVDARVDESMTEYETRFNALTASQQQDMEVIDARDGEVSLKARLDRDLRNPLQVYEDVEGSYISCDSTEGYLKDIEIIGNTIQNQNDLADIRSVGDKVENQELYEIPVLSCGKNLLDIPKYYEKQMQWTTGNYSTLIAYVKLNPNTDYTFTSKYSKSDNVVGHGGIGVYLFTSIPQEKDKWYITQTDVKTIFITEQPNITINKRFNTENYKYLAVYLGIATNSSHNHTAILENTQLEEGTVETPYEPHQEDKLTILSPVQLEKVGDVADRLICKDGVWGVEKNIGTVYYKDLVKLKETTVKKDNFLFVQGEHPNLTLNNYNVDGNTVLCSKKFLHSFEESEHMWYDSATTTFRFAISKEIISVFDSSKIIEYYTIENVFMKIQLAQPQFIPLPHDQQIALRTFANKTNISFGCEIEPTLKASVPKSLSSTVSTHTEQIDNLGKELDKVKKLEESTVSIVTTESNFTTVEETSNWYFEDVKLEGRTLVNLFGYHEIENMSETRGGIIYSSSKKVNGDFTLTFTAKTEHIDKRIQIGLTDIEYNGIYNELNKLIKTIEITSEYKNYIIHCSNAHEGYPSIRTVGAGAYLKDIIILEGDHTQNPPEFFEGIKSVGQDVDDITIATTNAPMLFGKGGKK